MQAKDAVMDELPLIDFNAFQPIEPIGQPAAAGAGGVADDPFKVFEVDWTNAPVQFRPAQKQPNPAAVADAEPAPAPVVEAEAAAGAGKDAVKGEDDNFWDNVDWDSFW